MPPIAAWSVTPGQTSMEILPPADTMGMKPTGIKARSESAGSTSSANHTRRLRKAASELTMSVCQHDAFHDD